MALVVRALKDQLAAQPDRLVNGLLTAGVWKPTASFEVTAPGGMFVAVGSGTAGDLAVVKGSASRQGVYIVENPDGTIPGNVAIAPGDASDGRIDLIVLKVYDDDLDSSGQTEAVVEVVEGTPATSPAAPSVPDSAIALAEVSVSAGESTAITGGDITDDRTYCQVRGSGADAVAGADLVPLSQVRDYVGAAVDFADDFAGANLGLTGSFQASGTFSYTPPAGWSTYTLRARGFGTVAGLTASDSVETVAVIDGGTGSVRSDNSAGTARTLPATHSRTGRSGSVDVEFRIRNTTASRGTVYSTWIDVIAVRES